MVKKIYVKVPTFFDKIVGKNDRHTNFYSHDLLISGKIVILIDVRRFSSWNVFFQ